MFEKHKILVNYYLGVLWNTWVFGAKHRELAKSNLYYKEVELGRDGHVVSIKSDLIESGVSKANIFEIIVLKYLFIALFAYLLFNMNLYYTSMLGLFVGSFAYIGFYQLKKRVSDFFAWFFMLVLFCVYMFLFIGFPTWSFEHKLNWVINYSIQYFLWLYLFERVFIDIYTGDYKKWYKVDGLKLTYFKLVDDGDTKDFEDKAKVGKRYFLFVTIIMMCIGLFFGGTDLAMKMYVSQEAQKVAMLKNNDELGIIGKKNADAMKRKLLAQSRELGIVAHTEDDLKLLDSNFDEYIKTKVIAYENVRISASNTFIDEVTGQNIMIQFSQQRPFYIVRAWVKMYKDGVYRWHFNSSDGKKVIVITNVKAR